MSLGPPAIQRATESWDTVAAIAGRMIMAASEFLDLLEAPQRERAQLPFTTEARLDWDYRPRLRPGLPLRAMREPQQAAAWRLIDLALSIHGSAKTRGVLALEAILQERTADKAYRDPLNYALAVFGAPGANPWAWRFEGHHVSLSLTLVSGLGIAVTPHFFGANPFSGRVVNDGHGGLECVLERESALAFQIVEDLRPTELAQALIASEAPPDFLTGPGRERSLREPAGLRVATMAPAQRELIERLIDTFIGHLAPEVTTPIAGRLRQSGLDSLRFAWAGATTPDRLHYWRLHGPTLLLEYDRTEPDHAHSVWHDPSDHFGEDLLRRHHETAHRHD